jgi:hypothetical protein
VVSAGLKALHLILLALASLLGAAQLVRPEKNQADQPSPNDITAHYPTPPAVKALLANACYDCHSNTTRYPWYAEVQPLAWWLADHVTDGKKHLNFSEFATYPPKRAAHKLEELIEEVNAREMPLASYRIAHADARLTADQTQLLVEWARAVRQRILADHNLAQ